MSKTMHDYAQIGAAVRLMEIQTEVAAIQRAFPELEAKSRKPRRAPAKAPIAASGPQPATKGPVALKPKRKMSLAARRAISQAQKRRWAAQKGVAE
jgi:hypothetical protein